MFSKVFITLFLAILLAGATQAQQSNPVLYQKGQGEWKDIVLPKDYVFIKANRLPDSDGQLSEEAAKTYFQHLRWKPDIQLIANYGIGYHLFARLGDKTSWLTRDNIGYFLEKIDSEAKAFELVMFFHGGVLLTGKTDIEALIEGSRTSKLARVADTMPKTFEPTCRFDPKRGAYRVSFCMYGARNVYEAKYLVTPEGYMARSLQNYVIGPTKVGGFAGEESATRHWKIFKAFLKPIAERLENIALKVMTNDELNEKGLAKTREYALDWLLSRGDVKRYAVAIDKFVRLEGSTINPRLNKLALRKLKLVRPADPLALADINLAITTHLAKRKALITSLIGKLYGKAHKSIKAKAIQTLGEIRAVEAVPDLIYYIDKPLSAAISDEDTVDNTFCAVPALVNIGKPAATACLDSIVSFLRWPQHGYRAKLYILVVLHVEGEKATRLLLQDRLENATNEQEVNNYKKAIESIEDVKSFGGIK